VHSHHPSILGAAKAAASATAQLAAGWLSPSWTAAAAASLHRLAAATDAAQARGDKGLPRTSPLSFVQSLVSSTDPLNTAPSHRLFSAACALVLEACPLAPVALTGQMHAAARVVDDATSWTTGAELDQALAGVGAAVVAAGLSQPIPCPRASWIARIASLRQACAAAVQGRSPLKDFDLIGAADTLTCGLLDSTVALTRSLDPRDRDHFVRTTACEMQPWLLSVLESGLNAHAIAAASLLLHMYLGLHSSQAQSATHVLARAPVVPRTQGTGFLEPEQCLSLAVGAVYWGDDSAHKSALGLDAATPFGGPGARLQPNQLHSLGTAVATCSAALLRRDPVPLSARANAVTLADFALLRVLASANLDPGFSTAMAPALLPTAFHVFDGVPDVSAARGLLQAWGLVGVDDAAASGDHTADSEISALLPFMSLDEREVVDKPAATSRILPPIAAQPAAGLRQVITTLRQCLQLALVTASSHLPALSGPLDVSGLAPEAPRGCDGGAPATAAARPSSLIQAAVDRVASVVALRAGEAIAAARTVYNADTDAVRRRLAALASVAGLTDRSLNPSSRPLGASAAGARVCYRLPFCLSTGLIGRVLETGRYCTSVLATIASPPVMEAACADGGATAAATIGVARSAALSLAQACVALSAYPSVQHPFIAQCVWPVVKQILSTARPSAAGLLLASDIVQDAGTQSLAAGLCAGLSVRTAPDVALQEVALWHYLAQRQAGAAPSHGPLATRTRGSDPHARAPAVTHACRLALLTLALDFVAALCAPPPCGAHPAVAAPALGQNPSTVSGGCAGDFLRGRLHAEALPVIADLLRTGVFALSTTPAHLSAFRPLMAVLQSCCSLLDTFARPCLLVPRDDEDGTSLEDRPPQHAPVSVAPAMDDASSRPLDPVLPVRFSTASATSGLTDAAKRSASVDGELSLGPPVLDATLAARFRSVLQLLLRAARSHALGGDGAASRRQVGERGREGLVAAGLAALNALSLLAPE
jgi:hypothetical protein